jgi:hypothetical protein
MPKKSDELNQTESLTWLADCGAPAPVDAPSVSANGRVETFTQGKVSFEFSRSLTRFFNELRELDLVKIRSLARSWGYEAPAELDETVVRMLVYASLQNYWYMEVRGEIPLSIITNSKERIRKYQQLIKKFHDNPDAFQAAAKPRTRLTRSEGNAFYSILKPDATFKGQAALVFSALSSGAQTLPEIVKYVDDSGQLTTKQATERVVKFYLNQFRHQNVVIQSTKPLDADTKKSKGGKK